MPNRFHVPDLDQAATTIALPEEEAHHARDVMRLRPGAPARVFDGRGTERAARVAEVTRRAVILVLDAPVMPVAEWRVRVTLAQAVLRGDRMDAVVRDATMMGVVAVQPLRSARAPAARGGGGTDLRPRWRRVAVASAKQCGRAVVPEVEPLVTASQWLARDRAVVRLVLVEPSARSGLARVDLGALADRARDGDAAIAVGPEGGWAEEELVAFDRGGFVPWSLGARTLRADAMAVAALAVLEYAWGG